MQSILNSPLLGCCTTLVSAEPEILWHCREMGDEAASGCTSSSLFSTPHTADMLKWQGPLHLPCDHALLPDFACIVFPHGKGPCHPSWLHGSHGEGQSRRTLSICLSSRFQSEYNFLSLKLYK